MPSMSYCRHENTLNDLEQVWEMWEEWTAEESNDYEASARRRLVKLVREMHDQFESDGTYDEVNEA